MSDEAIISQLGHIETDHAALLAAGAALGSPRTHNTPDARPYAVLPEGYTIEELPSAARPERPRAVVQLRDVASFVRYFNDHKTAASRIFARLDPALFLAVFDEFSEVAEGDGVVWPQADWREFRAAFAVPASREWKLWNEVNLEQMSQLSFAEFLQDNLPDVTQPAGADLLELALKFEAAQSGSYIANQRLQDGSHHLQWKADNNASGSVKLPEYITLSIPVFENEQPSELQARLRYRLKEGQLTLWYELVRPHKVLETAFRSAWDRIAAGTGAVILLGSPE